MVILVIDENRVLALERKREPPVPAHPHGPVPLKVALEWVQAVAGRIHVGRAGGRIQSGQDPSETVCVFWLNASLRAGFGKLLDAFVPIALKHVCSVLIHDTHCQWTASPFVIYTQVCRASTHESRTAWNADLTFLLLRDAHSSGGQTGVSFVHRRRANEEVALNTKVNPGVKGGSNATKRIISAGEIFPDGTMIELVAGSSGLDKPDFLLWDGKKASIGTHFKHGGRTYEVPELGPSLYRATRFPSRCDDYDSARDLFAAIADLFTRTFGFAGTGVKSSRLLFHQHLVG